MLSDFILQSPSHQLIDAICDSIKDDDRDRAEVRVFDPISGNGHPGDKEVHIGIDLLTWVVIWTDLTLEDALKFRLTQTKNEEIVINIQLDEPACKKFGVDKILKAVKIRIKEQDE